MLLTGSTGAAGIVWLLASGALGSGFAGRGGKTGGVVAGPVAMYCAMASRSCSPSTIGRSFGEQSGLAAYLGSGYFVDALFDGAFSDVLDAVGGDYDDSPTP